VALCFVAIIGIALASYIAVCSRAMNLSNRTFQGNLSKQLTELGMDEALRAFNKNDWSNWASNPTNVTSGAWTLDTTNKRATRTITFGAGKLAQGVTGTVKIRIDNYDANQLDSTWNSTTNYAVNDTVGYSGTWYRCVRAHSNQTPAGITNMGYWVPDPMPAPLWNSTATYKAQDVVYYTSDNKWYRCILAPTANQAPSNITYWTWISAITLGGGLAQNYEVNFDTDGWWYYLSGWIQPPPYPYVSWCWRQSSIPYVFNDLVLYGNPGVWYRCKTAHTSSAAILPTNTTYWENALTGMWGWSSSLSYNLGDVVYSGSSFYRCILAHTNKAPASNATYWSSAPLLSRDWSSSKRYEQNDTVRYNGIRYRSLQSSNTNQNPVTATTYWIGANTSTTSYQWNAGTAYSAGDYRCYGGAWYKCIAATTANAGHSPNNTTYWTASWAQGSGVTTGSTVIYTEGTLNIPGSPSVTTQLRTTIALAALFPNAAGATTSISANSGGTVDSYDSTTGTYASQVGSATNYSAVVAAGDTTGTAVTLSSTAVRGYVAAPSSSSTPYAPLFSSGGSVKGLSSPASPSIDLTRVSRSPFIPQFDPLPSGGLTAAFAASSFPRGTALALAATTNIGTPGAVTPSRYYINGNLTLSSASGYSILNINGPVILYLNGDLLMDSGSPNGKINISSTGSAEIHVAGKLTVNVGSDGINNLTLDPKKLIIICDTAASSVQNFSDATVPNVYGVFYLPNTTNASGLLIDNNNLNIYGAISAKKITYSGANMNIHYDTSLRYATFGGVDQPYTISEWRTLAITEQATMP
jgi:hypothetical protein